jgi:hypothetical protein
MAIRISKRWLYVADVLVLAVAVGLVVFSILRTPPKDTSTCPKAGKEHLLTLQADAFSQAKLTLQQCDTVHITNQDTQPYSLAFGVHDSHYRYPGFREQVLSPDEQLTITAVQAGQYRIHDHLRDQASAELTININE